METVIFEDEAGLDVTVINQLRYVGQHLLRCFSDPQLPIEELERAKRHAERALYDAHDLRIQHALNQISEFEQDCRDKNQYISGAFPDYADMLGVRDDARQFIANNNAESREDFYGTLEEYADKLEVFTRKLPHIRQQINAQLESRRKERNWQIFFFVAIPVLTFLAGIFLASFRENGG